LIKFLLDLLGVYLYGLYSIIAIVSDNRTVKIESLFLTIHIMSIVECTCQTFLLINAAKMYTTRPSMKQKKPGRSFIVLLILIDVCIWLIETLCVKKFDRNTTQLLYYDVVFWSIVSSISSPLAIFYRFHASVCLSDIWKTLYE